MLHDRSVERDCSDAGYAVEAKPERLFRRGQTRLPEPAGNPDPPRRPGRPASRQADRSRDVAGVTSVQNLPSSPEANQVIRQVHHPRRPQDRSCEDDAIGRRRPRSETRPLPILDDRLCYGLWSTRSLYSRPSRNHLRACFRLVILCGGRRESDNASSRPAETRGCWQIAAELASVPCARELSAV